jgi:hypothetical protein
MRQKTGISSPDTRWRAHGVGSPATALPRAIPAPETSTVKGWFVSYLLEPVSGQRSAHRRLANGTSAPMNDDGILAGLCAAGANAAMLPTGLVLAGLCCVADSRTRRMRVKGTADRVHAGKPQGFGPAGVSDHFCRRFCLSETKPCGVRRNFGTHGGQQWLHQFCAIRCNQRSFN